jgi:hypothetical protein
MPELDAVTAFITEVARMETAEDRAAAFCPSVAVADYREAAADELDALILRARRIISRQAARAGALS